MNRRQRERLAMIAFAIWSPYDRPDDEDSSVRADALRRWRGQSSVTEDKDEKQSHELSDSSKN
jgi:hypothetical protein